MREQCGAGLEHVRPSPDTLTPDFAVVSLTLLATGLDVDTGVALCFSPPSLRSRRYWTGGEHRSVPHRIRRYSTRNFGRSLTGNTQLRNEDS